MDIKLKKDLNDNEINFFKLLNTAKYDEAFECFNKNNLKKIDFILIEENEENENNEYFLRTPLFYIINSKIEDFNKIIPLFDLKLLHFDISNFNENDSPKLKDKQRNKTREYSSLYEEVYSKFSFILHNQRYSISPVSEIQKNVNYITLFLNEQKAFYNVEKEEKILNSVFLTKKRPHLMTMYYNQVIDSVPIKDKKNWSYIYVKCLDIPEISEKVLKEKIIDLNLNDMSADTRQLYISKLLNTQDFEKITKLLDKKGNKTEDYGDVLKLLCEYHNTTVRNKKIRVKVEKNIASLLEKGLNVHKPLLSGETFFEFFNKNIKNKDFLSISAQKIRNDLINLVETCFPLSEKKIILNNLLKNEVVTKKEDKNKKRL